MKKSIKRFWDQHPALFYGIALLMGVFLALTPSAALLLTILLFLASSWNRSNMTPFLLTASIITVSCLWVKSTYQLPHLPKEGCQGTGIFEVHNITKTSSHFGKHWIYKGSLQHFLSDNVRIGKNIPVSISIPDKVNVIRPKTDSIYLVEGILKEHRPGNYFLKINKETAWYPIEQVWNFVDLRLWAKKKVDKYIHSRIQPIRTANFLSGIATGEFDDRLLQHSFSRFGLQHIMAISGFHFAIIASILSLLFRLFLPQKWATLVLIFFLSSYFLFLGPSPSILRAWISIVIALIGLLIGRAASGLNNLGLGLLCVLIFNPLWSQHIGFQYSFGTTAFILLFYPIINTLLQEIFNKRPLSQVCEMNFLDQHGYCLVTALRQSLALMIAVNLFALPVTLFYFQKFPLLSLLYNLFFPFMVSISMLLLICSSLVDLFCSYIGIKMHSLNASYSSFMLNFTENFPLSLDLVWKTSPFPAEYLIVYLFIVVCIGIQIKNYYDLKNQNLKDLVFV